MTKLLLSIITIVFSYSLLCAQSNPAEVRLRKINALLEKDKIDNAEEQLVDLLNEYSTYGRGWDLLRKIRLYQYNQSKSISGLFGGKITVTTKDKDGNEIESKDDSLGTALMNMLSSVDPSKLAYNKYIYTLRKATLLSNTAYHSAIYLRNEIRAIDVDTLVSTKALKYYNKAEEEFAAKNYNNAAKLYKRTLEYQPDFYKAQLYLADVYFYMGNYLEAIKNFKLCSNRYPMFLEPRKYLVDAYSKEGLYEKALTASIETMLVYPDPSIFAKFEDLVYLTDNKVAVDWEPRPVFPNTIDRDNGTIRFNQYSDPDPMEPIEHWVHYAEALPKIEEYCDTNGVITKSNKLTSTKYLEVYSWQEMLNNSDSKKLEQARNMQKKGYLDCFVLITCFHDDIYDQYLHFVTHNKEKVMEYFRNTVVSHQ